MTELKTKKTSENVSDFLNNILPQKKREDCITVANMMKEITGHEPKMWGSSIIGFGDYHYKYENGREQDWFPVGFSPRKQNITFYSGSSFPKYPKHLKKLGKHTLGGGCLYINDLDDIDISVLNALIKQSYQDTLNK